MLSPDRFFDPEPTHKTAALEIYEAIKALPILSPHGHVDPAIFSNPNYHFSNPYQLLVQSDHYILRMLFSHGVPYEQLLSDTDPEGNWQTFCEHFYLFRATPSGLWLDYTLQEVFGFEPPLNSHTAAQAYAFITDKLAQPAFSARSLFKQFNIEVLATTDPAYDKLSHHQAIIESGWQGRIIPTFRADSLVKITDPHWLGQLSALSAASKVDIIDYNSFIRALEKQREFFKSLGAVACDLSFPKTSAFTLPDSTVEAIFQRALASSASTSDQEQFAAHMMMTFARMSSEDGLVMMMHNDVYRNYDSALFTRFGPDLGFDIPRQVEYTRNLLPLLNAFGKHPKFNLVLFCLDESAYTRELAPLAGAYPAVKLGAPWWYQDSWQGMQRYLNAVIEIAGVYNTSGFVDDTRNLVSIPARHDLWRRAATNWLAGLKVRGMINQVEAIEIATALAYNLAKQVYKL